MKKYNDYHNGNKKRFSFSCLFGLHDWYWTHGKEDGIGSDVYACVCQKCNEMRAIKCDDLVKNIKAVKKTLGIPGWVSIVTFNWNFVAFEIDDDVAVRTT